jgi:hypothetical protein
VKALFRCDLEEGERQTTACFGGPDVIDLADLPDFSRFCTDFPSVFVDNGIEAASTRVMFQLAQGESVVIEDGQAWKFEYISQEGGSQVGVSSKCDDPVLVDDLLDKQDQQVILQARHLEFETYGKWDGNSFDTRETTLHSGQDEFFTSTPILIDESLCPYSEDYTQSYPEDDLPRECFTIKAWDTTFKEGTSHDYGGVQLTLTSLSVKFDEHPVVGRRYAWVANWVMDFSDDGIQFVDPALPSQSSGEEEMTLTITSQLPGPTTLFTQVLTYYTVVGEETSTVVSSKVPAYGTTSEAITVPSQFLGSTSLSTLVSLDIEGDVIIFSGFESEYEVVNVVTDNSLVSVNDIGMNEVSLSVWERFWAWLRGLFT